jgi:hypothetical protein
MDFIESLLYPEVVIGALAGLAAAALIHWFAPKPEPLLVEAGLVALGAVGGFIFGNWNSDER